MIRKTDNNQYHLWNDFLKNMYIFVLYKPEQEVIFKFCEEHSFKVFISMIILQKYATRILVMLNLHNNSSIDILRYEAPLLSLMVSA